MKQMIFLILVIAQSGSPGNDETYLKRTAESWSTDLKHPDAKARRAAAFAMGKLGKHALPYLDTLKMLCRQDVDAGVRIASATALGELSPWAANDIAPLVIQAFVMEKEISVRRALALVIGKVGDRAGSAEPMLRKALDDPDAALRQNAAWALGQLGKAAEPAIPRLMTAISDTEAGVRAEAVQALGNLGTLAEDAIPLLTRALADRDARVQEQSVIALRRMGPLAASAIASLLTLAESTRSEATLRQAALITIESIWPTGLKETVSWNRLQELARSAKDDMVKAAAQQAEKKISALRK